MEACIEWNGLRFPNGYGRITSRPIRRSGHLHAHRWAYEKFYGPIPFGKIVMHACDNKPCIHPRHLLLGTIRENTQDAASKGFCRKRKSICRCGRPYTVGKGPKGPWYCRPCKTEYARRKRG